MAIVTSQFAWRRSKGRDVAVLAAVIWLGHRYLRQLQGEWPSHGGVHLLVTMPSLTVGADYLKTGKGEELPASDPGTSPRFRGDVVVPLALRTPALRNRTSSPVPFEYKGHRIARAVTLLNHVR